MPTYVDDDNKHSTKRMADGSYNEMLSLSFAMTYYISPLDNLDIIVFSNTGIPLYISEPDAI